VIHAHPQALGCRRDKQLIVLRGMDRNRYPEQCRSNLFQARPRVLAVRPATGPEPPSGEERDLLSEREPSILERAIQRLALQCSRAACDGALFGDLLPEKWRPSAYRIVPPSPSNDPGRLFGFDPSPVCRADKNSVQKIGQTGRESAGVDSNRNRVLTSDQEKGGLKLESQNL